MIPTMSSEAVARSRTPVLKFVPFAAFALAVMVAVLGQAAWLDGKIEILQEGQATIRERLAGVESRVAGLETSVGEISRHPSEPAS